PPPMCWGRKTRPYIRVLDSRLEGIVGRDEQLAEHLKKGVNPGAASIPLREQALKAHRMQLKKQSN
ncbi:hypothetical protein KI387_005937, partial [Taxus chinensis]